MCSKQPGKSPGIVRTGSGSVIWLGHQRGQFNCKIRIVPSSITSTDKNIVPYHRISAAQNKMPTRIEIDWQKETSELSAFAMFYCYLYYIARVKSEIWYDIFCFEEWTIWLHWKKYQRLNWQICPSVNRRTWVTLIWLTNEPQLSLVLSNLHITSQKKLTVPLVPW